MNKILLRSRFFPPRRGQAWRYYLKDTIGEIPYVIKSMYQRARRGWADCDVWSLDSWFQHVVPEMLRQLATDNTGSPSTFFPKGMLEDYENNEHEIDRQHYRWTKVLRQMADDLEAHDRFWDAVMNKDFLKDSDHEEFMRKEDASLNKVKAGLMAFYEYFYTLWD
jgi:hypothetical protein